MGIKKQTLILMILAFFGVVWLTGMTHEAFHVLTGKGANAICWDFGMKMEDDVQTGYLLWHTGFNVGAYDSISEYNSWRELSEKYTTMFIDQGMYGILCMLIGILGTQIYFLQWGKD